MENKYANPAPLGLMGFGMTTILLNIHNTGLFPLTSMVLAMGIFYGGIAQIIAGIMEFKKGNTFGLTAFVSYGSFWLTLVFILVFKNLPGVSPQFMGLANTSKRQSTRRSARPASSSAATVLAKSGRAWLAAIARTSARLRSTAIS